MSRISTRPWSAAISLFLFGFFQQTYAQVSLPTHSYDECNFGNLVLRYGQDNSKPYETGTLSNNWLNPGPTGSGRKFYSGNTYGQCLHQNGTIFDVEMKIFLTAKPTGRIYVPTSPGNSEAVEVWLSTDPANPYNLPVEARASFYKHGTLRIERDSVAGYYNARLLLDSGHVGTFRVTTHYPELLPINRPSYTHDYWIDYSVGMQGGFKFSPLQAQTNTLVTGIEQAFVQGLEQAVNAVNQELDEQQARVAEALVEAFASIPDVVTLKNPLFGTRVPAPAYTVEFIDGFGNEYVVPAVVGVESTSTVLNPNGPPEVIAVLITERTDENDVGGLELIVERRPPSASSSLCVTLPLLARVSSVVDGATFSIGYDARAAASSAPLRFSVLVKAISGASSQQTATVATQALCQQTKPLTITADLSSVPLPMASSAHSRLELSYSTQQTMRLTINQTESGRSQIVLASSAPLPSISYEAGSPSEVLSIVLRNIPERVSLCSHKGNECNIYYRQGRNSTQSILFEARNLYGNLDTMSAEFRKDVFNADMSKAAESAASFDVSFLALDSIFYFKFPNLLDPTYDGGLDVNLFISTTGQPLVGFLNNRDLNDDDSFDFRSIAPGLRAWDRNIRVYKDAWACAFGECLYRIEVDTSGLMLCDGDVSFDKNNFPGTLEKYIADNVVCN